MEPARIPPVDNEQVTAFRLDSHHLCRRLPAGSLLTAAGACGMQNTPPGSAELALHARVSGLAPGKAEQALVEEKTLLQVWSLRASPYIFPTLDSSVFTHGLLPGDEKEIRWFISGVEPALDQIGISAAKVVELAAAALEELLIGRTLTKDELGIEMAGWIRPRLGPEQAAAWQSPSWYAPGQSQGESVARFALPVLALQGLCCHAERRVNQAFFRLTREWLDSPLPQPEPDPARAELVRRYLHCYGPSTAAHFAEWAGIFAGQAARAWSLIEPELAEVRFGRRSCWLLRQDAPLLESPSTPTGVRLLPPHDPYLGLRDRATLISDQELQRAIWRTSGNPGAVLVDGRFAATWRPQKTGRRLKIAVAAFAPIQAGTRSQIEAEAETLAPYKDCTAVEVAFTGTTPEP